MVRWLLAGLVLTGSLAAGLRMLGKVEPLAQPVVQETSVPASLTSVPPAELDPPIAVIDVVDLNPLLDAPRVPERETIQVGFVEGEEPQVLPEGAPAVIPLARDLETAEPRVKSLPFISVNP